MTTIQAQESISYSRPILTPTDAVSLNYEVRLTKVTPSEIVFDHYVDLNPDSVRNKLEVAVTAGTAGDVYALNIAIPNNTAYPAHYMMRTGDTATTIASYWVKVIDLCPYVQAKLKTGTPTTIVIEAVTGGVEVTLTKSESTDDTKIAISEITQESVDAADVCALSSTSIKFELLENSSNIDKNGTPVILGKVTFYDGQGTATGNQYAQGSYSQIFAHRLTIDSIQSEAGYERS